MIAQVSDTTSQTLGYAEILFVLFAALFIVPFVWGLIDAIARPPERFNYGSKVGWITGMICAWVVASGWAIALIYLLVVRRKMGPPHPKPGRSIGS